MLLWTVIIVLFFLTLGNYLSEKSVLYPPFLFCLLWLSVLLVYSAHFIEVDELQATVLIVVGVGAFLFSLGGAVASLVPKMLIKMKIRVGPRLANSSHEWFQYCIAAFGFIGMLLVLKSTLAAGAGAEGATFLARARAHATSGEDSTGSFLTTYIPELTTFGAVMISIERSDWLFRLMTTLAFMTAVLTTGRAPILQLFCGIVTISMIQRGNLNLLAALRFVRIPALGFLGLFILLIFTNKDTSSLEGSVASIALFSLVTYLVGPIAALNKFFETPTLYVEQANHTLKFPLQILTRLHLINYAPPPLIDEFVAVPFPANVYTGYKFFYTDYGFAGAAIAILFIGFAHTLLYRKAISGSRMGLYVFGMSVLPLILFFFDDLYSALGVDLTIFLFGCLYCSMRYVSLAGTSSTQQHPELSC